MKNIIRLRQLKNCLNIFRLGYSRQSNNNNGLSLYPVEMEEFLVINGVFHSKMSSYNPAFNGVAENIVRIYKYFLKQI